jgi:type III restriction enzyme
MRSLKTPDSVSRFRTSNNGDAHEYIPDFIVRLKTEPPLHLIIEVKGYDERTDIKAQAAHKWVDALSADGACARWAYASQRNPPK